MENLWSWLGELAASVGITGLLIGGGIKLWGEKWLKGKFDKELEEHKSELIKQRMKHQQRIDWQTSQINKMREKEYELLPELWANILDIKTSLRKFIGAFHPAQGLDQKSGEEIDEICQSYGFSTTQIDKIKKSQVDKENKFVEIYVSNTANEAIQKWHLAKSHFDTNKLFIDARLKELVEKILDKQYDAFAAYCCGLESNDNAEKKEGRIILERKIPPLISELEATIQARLNQKLDFSPPPSQTPEQDATA